MTLNTSRGDDRTGQPPAARAVDSPYLSATGRAIRAEIESLIPLIRAEAQTAERTGALTPAVLKALDEAGVYRMTMPVEWGGHALGARDLVEVIATIAEGDGSAAWSAWVGVGVRNVLALEQTVVDRLRKDAETWVGPLVAGASVFSTAVGDARKVDGGWMVQGFWPFGSGCKHSAWAVVGVAYDPAHGSGRGTVLLESGQYEIVEDWDVMGLSASSSNSLRVAAEIFVPDDRFLDIAGIPEQMLQIQQNYTGAAFRQGGSAIMVTVTLSNVAIALGMARGALACFIEQAGQRKPFNVPYPNLAEMPSVQVAVGKARTITSAAAALIEGNADQVDARTNAGFDFSVEEQSAIVLDLSYATNLCGDAIDLLQKTMGSSTVTRKNPIQRFARDARVMSTHGALRFDPLAEIDGRRLLGLPPFPMFAGVLPDRIPVGSH